MRVIGFRGVGLTTPQRIWRRRSWPPAAPTRTWRWRRAGAGIGLDVIAECGARLHLAHPLGIAGYENRRVKNDVRDATLLADLLRMGRLPSRGSLRRRCGSCARWFAIGPSWVGC